MLCPCLNKQQPQYQLSPDAALKRPASRPSTCFTAEGDAAFSLPRTLLKMRLSRTATTAEHEYRGEGQDAERMIGRLV